MKITVEMTKDEFLNWNNFLEYKNIIKSGIIEIEDMYNTLVTWFMAADSLMDIPESLYNEFENNILKDFRSRINKLKEGSEK